MYRADAAASSGFTMQRAMLDLLKSRYRDGCGAEGKTRPLVPTIKITQLAAGCTASDVTQLAAQLSAL